MPYFEDGLIELISLYLHNSEFDKAKPLVERFKSKSEFDQSTMTALLSQYPDDASSMQ